MQTSTLVILACLLAVVVAQAQQAPQPLDPVYEANVDIPEHDTSPRSKRGLLFLKKKLILGALGLKAAKVTAVGAAAALALKAKSKPIGKTYYHSGW